MLVSGFGGRRGAIGVFSSGRRTIGVFGGWRRTIGVFGSGRRTIGRFLSHRRSIGWLRTVVREETFLPVDFLLGGNMDQLGLTHRHWLLPALLPLDVLTVGPRGRHTVGRVLHLQRE